MYLNLGAGRVIFPAIEGEEPQHLIPLAPECYEAGWLNCDKYRNEGINETFDLFRFPWVRSSNGALFNDNSVDLIWCSHIVEHIPHQVQLAKNLPEVYRRQYEPLIDSYDGWFVFFEECYRILKPNGRIIVIAPWGNSVPGDSDPTHTRRVLPNSFGYLSGDNPDAPFDYHLKCHFEQDSELMVKYTNAWHTRLASATPEEATRASYMYYNVIETFRLSLRAVKHGGD